MFYLSGFIRTQSFNGYARDTRMMNKDLGIRYLVQFQWLKWLPDICLPYCAKCIKGLITPYGCSLFLCNKTKKVFMVSR